MDTDNITLRKQNTRSLTNLSLLINDDEKTILDTTMMSVPDSLQDYNNGDDVNDLNEQINALKIELMSAHQEIDYLNSENFRLKSDLERALKTDQACKKTCLTPSRKSNTPSSLSKQKSMLYNIRPIISNNDSNMTSTNYCKDIIVETHDKETQTSEISYNTVMQSNNSTSFSQLGNIAQIKPVGVSQRKHKNKLAIMSSRCTKGTLPLIEEIFCNEFDYCHYLLNNADTEELLSIVKNNIKHFTMQDYCLIFIGENDLRNNEYLDILVKFKSSLETIKHTNIVICAPTYIRGALIHNYKVELFNNLLSLDIKNHQYAYFFDSNYTLTLDMFSYNTGKINKHGWRDIFDQIKSKILFDYDQDYSKVSNDNHRHIEDHGVRDNTSNLAVNDKANHDSEFFL